MTTRPPTVDDARVLAGDVHVLEHDVVVGRAADADDLSGQIEGLPGCEPLDHLEEEHRCFVLPLRRSYCARACRR